MRIDVLTLPFDPLRRCFDAGTLEAVQRTKSVLSCKEHLFTVHDLPHLLLVVVSAAVATSEAPAHPVAPREAQEPAEPALPPEVQARYATLRAWRNSTAYAEGVPPYVVLTNRQVRALAERNPSSRAAIAEIEGIGDKKLERYGAPLLQLLHPAPVETPL